MSLPHRPDVLIVGAGPVGLALGCSLRLHDVDCLVVDRNTGPVKESRATDIHARTLELCATLGITNALIARGKRSHAAWFYSGGHRVAGFSTDELPSPYPFILGLPQCATEEVLLARFLELGGRVLREHSFVKLEQFKDHVTTTLTNAEGKPFDLESPWLVGCDGSTSAVRKTLGLPFEGDTYEELFLLADMRIDWPRTSDELHLFLTEDGFFMVLPMPDGWVRAFASIPPDRGDLQADRSTFERLIRERVDGPCEVLETGWIAQFRIHRRMVPRYREGRVFLAGDAAHIHSPVGGQGMNIGIQDAMNLGFKLALVARNRAHEKLLDSYQVERHHAAARTLRDTHLATTLSMLENPFLRIPRDLLGRATQGSTALARWMCELVASFHGDVSDSPAVESTRGSLLRADVVTDYSTEEPSLYEHLSYSTGTRAGERAPYVRYGENGDLSSFSLLASNRHTLLLFDGLARTHEGYLKLDTIAHEVQERFSHVIRPLVVIPDGVRPLDLAPDVAVIGDPGAKLHEAFAAHAECAFLIRPDGYVAFRCQPAEPDEIRQFLEKTFVPQDE
ncbi:MAG TPA: FAD-dependent monooxygenase [Polyangium sp.]|nr:FAD-dependent monooxygenase [Polyangium sp.]